MTLTAEFELDTDEFERELAHAAVWLGETAAKHVDQFGDVAADRMRANVPVDTGQLRDSIDAKAGDDEDGHYVDVGSFGVWYALYVEMGTSEHAAHAFILPGLEEAYGMWAVI